MGFLKKFLFVLLFVIIWDTISFSVNNGVSCDFKEVSIINYALKISVIFILFLVLNRFIAYKNK